MNEKESLIVKIYDDSKREKYENEKDILTEIKTNIQNNDTIIKLKDLEFYANMFNYPIQNEMNHKCLFFEYLQKLSLFDYITQSVNQIPEKNTKYIAYKLLTSIGILKENNIFHNKIDISKIMFDQNFNLKLIHFSEAKKIKDKNEKYLDLFGLGQTLVKLISLGKCKSICYDKKSKLFYILVNFEMSSKSQKKYLKVSEFWKNIENNIKISADFKTFFNALITTRISNEEPNIDLFIRNKWLTEIFDCLEKNEKEFNNYFKSIYEKIIDNNKIDNKIEVDIEDIIRLKGNKEEKKLSTNIINSALPESFNKISSGFSRKKEISYNEPNNYTLVDENFVIPFKKTKLTNLKIESKQIKNNKENLNDGFKSIYNKINENSGQMENNIIINETNFIESKDKTNCEKSLLRGKNINNPNKTLLNLGITKENFNYLHLIIKNDEKKDVTEALINFLGVYKTKIKDFYATTDMCISFKEEETLSFIIAFEIDIHDNQLDAEFEFFDEDTENKYENGNKFEIKVELKFKPDNDSNINECILLFNNIIGDKEDFYEHLKIIKNIAKNLLLNNNLYEE